MYYIDFINNIIETRGRFACGKNYHERHHIIPKSCGGSDCLDNKIDLFAQEHFIAHKLLAEENPDNNSLVYAYALMAFTYNEHQERYELTPAEYETARITFSNMLKQRYKNKENHPSYGKPISEERKKLISEANKGNKYCVGRYVSLETRRKIGEANRNPSEITRQKMSIARKGQYVGAKNPRAKQVIRLSDGKIYDCAKTAALDNNINYATFKTHVQKNKGFSYIIR